MEKVRGVVFQGKDITLDGNFDDNIFLVLYQIAYNQLLIIE